MILSPMTDRPATACLGMVAAALLACAATPARAEWMSAGQLADLCASTVPTDRGLCLSYVMGVLDGGRWRDPALKTPDDQTGGQVRDVVVRHLVAHPEGRDQPARLAVQAAVAEAWPALQARPAAKAPAKPKKPVRKRRTRG
ncbi:Rap1a/Tai family immunity protein [Novosphingobium cyanobacteriorum]|uniref:Rap1a/Tai family immunity protein n=1 Tax=Novosphingobium cyanobacteriorum TaxID=3024215 RepID=A0ABT6CFM6_9SPHN|nr:Rap1a/Tai family immunity protein [Novosphingobium cyanobacteriorum]MDF8332581.1 Rap1a/Tai family immunity protein [Novosphingobium cyanobacteriorum]